MVAFFKVCQQLRAFLSGSGLAHDLAAFDSLLLALRYTGQPVGPKIITREWPRMVHMRLKRQHQRWTLPDNPHASVAMAMDAALVTFGPLEPLENQPPRYPQTPPAQSCSLSWRNAEGRDPGSTATPPATRGTAPYALPWSPQRSAAEWHRPLGALGHIGPRAPKHHESHRVHGPYSQPAGSTATLPPPFLGLQVTIQRVADVL